MFGNPPWGAYPPSPHRPLAVAASAIMAQAIAAIAFNNGVARTPPMGCNPYNSIAAYNDQMFRHTADAVVASGMKAAGYTYVNNDCGNWFYDLNNRSVPRDGAGVLRVDTAFFPSGLKVIGDYLHGKGLKFGLYIMPAMAWVKAGDNSTTNDAASYKQWGVDYLKFDGWSGSTTADFEAMRDALRASGHPVVFSVNGERGPDIANMWRTSGDIDPAFSNWSGNIGTMADGGSAPGGWADPDMFTIGTGMPEDEEVAQFSLWCVTSSPLIAGNDVRVMFPFTQYVMQNTEAIAIDQDTAFSVNPAYGGSGKRIKASGATEIWAKTVTGGAKAVVLFNTGSAAASITVNWSDLGLSGTAQVRDLWEHGNKGPFTGSYSASVPSHGVKFLKVVPGTSTLPEPPATWYPKPQPPAPITLLPRAGWSLSTDIPGSLGQDIAKAIDGSLETQAVSYEGDQGDSNYVQVDMQRPQDFNCVVTSSTSDGVGPFLKPYSVYRSTRKLSLYVSNNGTTWTGPVDTTCGGPLNYVCMTFPKQNARYLRIVQKYVGDQRTGWSFDRRYLFFILGELYVGTGTPPPIPALPNGTTSTGTPPPRLRNRSTLSAPGGSNASQYTLQGRRLGHSPQGAKAHAPGMSITGPAK